MPDDMQTQLQGIARPVRRQRSRRLLWINGILAAVGFGILWWAAHHAYSELSYAELADIEIRRDASDPEQVALYYRPLSSGTIGFGRVDGDRRTERLEQVVSGAVGKRQKFQWRLSGLTTGETIEVTYLKGWWRVKDPYTVPELPELPDLPELPEPAVPSGERGALTSGQPAPQLPVRRGEGVLAGCVVNAIDNRPVPDAEVQIAGTTLHEKTDADGYFRLTGVPAGTVCAVVSATGFIPDQFQQELVAGRESSVRRVLSPAMQKGQIRLVLTWGDEPKDLDAHLEGPLPGGQRFHVYYHRKGDLASASNKKFVRLDVDEQQGEGPETVTVLGLVPGVYRYFVHNYSGREDPQSVALARSGAEVKLYQGGQIYRFRAGHDQPGNVWDVCAIEVTGEGAIVKRIDDYKGIKADQMVGLYDKRTRADRPRWIVNYGGSQLSEKAVTDGLAWLARHQADDGFWSSECLADGQWSQCAKSDPCTGPGRKYEMAQTGLALLAFQAGGHYYFNKDNAKYSDRVRRGLDWMVEHQRDDGALVSEKEGGGHSRYHTFYMYDHGIAAFALADACAAAAAMGQPANQRYTEACRRAIQYIESQQHDDGGWRYTDDFTRPGDASVTGWQVLALKSAKEAGIEVNYRRIEMIRDFFRRLEMGRDGRTWYRNDSLAAQKQESDATTGIGMLARQFLLDEPDAALIPEAARYLAEMAESNAAAEVVKQRDLEYRLKYNYYLWYNCTLAMFHAGGEPWQRFNKIIRDTIIGLQRHDGCARGSWDPDTQWGQRGGRIYTTALAILTLEVYYRYTQQEEISPGSLPLEVIIEGELPQSEPAVPSGNGPEPVVLPSRRF